MRHDNTTIAGHGPGYNRMPQALDLAAPIPPLFTTPPDWLCWVQERVAAHALVLPRPLTAPYAQMIGPVWGQALAVRAALGDDLDASDDARCLRQEFQSGRPLRLTPWQMDDYFRFTGAAMLRYDGGYKVSFPAPLGSIPLDANAPADHGSAFDMALDMLVEWRNDGHPAYILLRPLSRSLAEVLLRILAWL